MPPAAPLPTTITSQRAEPGLMVEASRRDSSRLAERSMSRVGSAGMSGLRLLPAPGAVLAVHGLAADELEQDLVALVAQLLVDTDLGRVVAVDGGLLRGDEEGLQGRPLPRLVRAAADVRGLLVLAHRRRSLFPGHRRRALGPGHVLVLLVLA